MSDELKKIVLIDDNGEASEDLPQYHAVTLSSGSVSVAGDGADATGIVTRQYGSGEQATIVTDGIVPVVCGTAGSLAVGDPVAVDANGQVDAGTSADPVLGYLKTAPSADGDIVQIRISSLIVATIA